MNNNYYNLTEITSKTVKNASGKSGICPAEKLPFETVPAMAYIPYQLDRTAFSPDEALKKGTLFTVLNKPFKGGKCRE